MNFTDTGTLINWQLDDINIIEPVHSKEGGGTRGGVYLCIPNFEELSPPFSIKHREYRTTVCDSQLPHQKNLTASKEYNWGDVEVITYWEEKDDQSSKTLKVTTKIRALSHTAWVRPGFHPYFSITQDSFIQLGAMRIDVQALPHDSMRAYPAAALTDEVKLNTADYTASMSCEISSPSQQMALAFAVWSDKKTEYVCIEPVIGEQPGDDDLPSPLRLLEAEELMLAFTIRADRLGVAGALSNL